jgi:16S rRNA (guanine1516-N2)-methyltransferase
VSNLNWCQFSAETGRLHLGGDTARHSWTNHVALVVRHGQEEGTATTVSKLNLSNLIRLEGSAAGYSFKYGANGLSLVKTLNSEDLSVDKDYAISCDFVGGSVRHRRHYGGGLGQTLARAVGISSKFKPLIADLTAGLGRDAFVFATLGAQVMLVERNQIVIALLTDGLIRLRQSAAVDPILKLISDRLELHNADGKSWLRSLDRISVPDVIYLDPMFPSREKSARVKKEMAIFQCVVGEDADAGELLEIALQNARYRVVLKRPRRAASLAGTKPDFSIGGKTTRYDIYAVAKMPR